MLKFPLQFRPSRPRCIILKPLQNFEFINLLKLKSSQVKIRQMMLLLLLCALFFIFCCYLLVRGGNGSEKVEQNNRNRSQQGRILCYVLLAPELMPAAKTIQETWGNKCDKLIFFGNFQSKEPDVSVTLINASEGYSNLWGKTKAALLHLQNFEKNFDWYIKADSDTYVIVNNLRKFARNLDSENPIWFGYKLKHSKLKEGYMSGGAGYAFSKRALEKVSNVLKMSRNENIIIPTELLENCRIIGSRGYEDLELGKCFSHVGVKGVSTLDIHGKERFLPLPLSTLISGDLTNFHWIWQKAWYRPRVGPSCCSKELISMHQISPSGMRTLHFLLEAMNN